MSISNCFVTFDSVHFDVGRILELLFCEVVPSFWLKFSFTKTFMIFDYGFFSRNVMGLPAFTTQHGVMNTQQLVNTIIVTKYDQA